jgi:putative holliday junction resolvase
MHPALGIDYGDARIGIAATDSLGIMAHPVDTIHQDKKDPISRIKEIIQERKIKNIVLGLPLHLDGREGESAKKVRVFSLLLKKHFPQIPVIFVNEAFTTKTAAAKLHAAGKNSKQQKLVIDKIAAVVILNQWMEETC